MNVYIPAAVIPPMVVVLVVAGIMVGVTGPETKVHNAVFAPDNALPASVTVVNEPKHRVTSAGAMAV